MCSDLNDNTTKNYVFLNFCPNTKINTELNIDLYLGIYIYIYSMADQTPTKKKTVKQKQQQTPTKRYICLRRGCNQAFNHRTQLIRHKAKCTLLSPHKKGKPWKKDNDKNYQCEKCKKSFSYRTSITRHVQTCKPSKVKENKCTFCDRIFPYLSDLKRHLKVHEKKGEMMVPSFIPSASASASSLFDDTSELPSLDHTMLSGTTAGSSFISTSPNDVSMFSDTGPSLDLSIESRQVEVVLLNSTIIPEDNPEDSFDDTPGITTELVRHQDDTTEDFPGNISEVAPLHQHINVAPNTVIDGSGKWKDILTHTDAAGVREADIYHCLIQHLKSLIHSGKCRH